MQISDWAFSIQEEDAALKIAQQVAEDRKRTDLPIYTQAVAIDGPLTQDRDDAINFKFGPESITIESYIAHPTRFIKAGSILDEAAARRVNTLYLRKGNYPMLPRCLSEDALSLNAGHLNPAIKISTRIHTQSGKIESIHFEQCLVQPENTTYEDVSAKLHGGDRRYDDWNKAAKWLRNFRETHSSHVVLPTYDHESGVMHGEDGGVEYIAPRLIDSHNIVQEAMIITNHSCASLMQQCFDYGLYRGQKKVTSKALYTDEPGKHASLAMSIYTHTTSPNRRYSDMITHRYLEQLGDSFELDVAHPQPIKFPAPYARKEQKQLLATINASTQFIKDYYKDQRREIADTWLQKVFPNTDAEKLKTFDPLSFSDLLKAAAKAGQINEIFASEIEARIKGKGSEKGDYSLNLPKDAITVFCYCGQQKDSDGLWDRVRTEMLHYLAANPQKLEEVFGEFVAKLDGEFFISQASFVTKPQKNPKETARYYPVASVILAELEGKTYTTDEFAIGFTEKTSVTRAKLEFLKAYASGHLVQSNDPVLPDPEKVYTAKNLYVENASERKHELIRRGYTLEETSREFAPAKGAIKGRGFKYEIKITKDAKTVITVSVKRDNLEEAEKIGLDVAIMELRGKGHLNANQFAHNGLSTFSGRLKNGHGITYGDGIIVASRQTIITDPSSCAEFMEIMASGGYKMHRDGKAIKITLDAKVKGNDVASPSVEDIKNTIIQLFPRVVLVAKPGAITIQHPPQDLLQLCKPGIQR